MTNPINNPGSAENEGAKPVTPSTTSAETASALLGDNVSPEVNGYTMEVAKYLIAHNRAEEVARDYVKYSREGNDAVAFALIEAIDNIYDNDIPEDTLKRYNQWIVSQKPAKTVEKKEIPSEYREFLANAGQLWIDDFLTYAPETQKRLSEIIEFTPDTIAVKTVMKIQGAEKNVKISIDKNYVQADMNNPKVLEAIKQGDIRVCEDGVTRSTIVGGHAMIPDELRIKGSTLLALANTMPYKEDFQRSSQKKHKMLYAVGALLNLTEGGVGTKGQDKIHYDVDGYAALMSGGYAMNKGVSTGEPIVLSITPKGLVDDHGGRMFPRIPGFMSPTMKLAKPIEVLD